MRTIKTALIAVLIAAGAILSGQALEADYIQTAYTDQSSSTDHNSSRIEQFFSNLLNRSVGILKDAHPEPVICMTFVVDDVNIVYEKELAVEEWMTSPFGGSYVEPELAVESWMTEPFGNSYNEPELTVESWMTEPFGNRIGETELAVESWMTELF